MLYFGGWEPAAWLGIVVIVLVHELGHAVFVRIAHARVTEVMVYGFGGYCSWQGAVSDRGRAFIAWGGIAGQAILYVIAAIILATVPVYDRFAYVFLYTLTSSNLILAALNLLPIPPLDGAAAWPLVPMLWRDFMRGGGTRPSSNPAAADKADASKVVPLVPVEPKPPPVGSSSSSRVTDPEQAERMFQRVYDGLIKDASPTRRENTDRDPE